MRKKGKIYLIMRVGIVFHKNPLAPPTGIDLVRLRAISLGFIRKGINVEVIAPVDREGILEEIVPVRRLEALEEACSIRYRQDVLPRLDFADRRYRGTCGFPHRQSGGPRAA